MSIATITTSHDNRFNSGDVIEVNGMRFIVNAVTSGTSISIGAVRWLWLPLTRWFYMRGFTVDHTAYNFFIGDGKPQ